MKISFENFPLFFSIYFTIIVTVTNHHVKFIIRPIYTWFWFYSQSWHVFLWSFARTTNIHDIEDIFINLIYVSIFKIIIFFITSFCNFCKNHHQTQSLQIIFFEDHDVLTTFARIFKSLSKCFEKINFTSSFKKSLLYDVLKIYSSTALYYPLIYNHPIFNPFSNDVFIKKIVKFFTS